MKKTSFALISLFASAMLVAGCSEMNSADNSIGNENNHSTSSNGPNAEEKDPIAEKTPAQSIATSNNGIFNCHDLLQPVPDDEGVNGTAEIHDNSIKIKLKNDVNVAEGMGAEIVSLADPHTCGLVSRGLMVTVDDSGDLVVNDSDINAIKKADVGYSNAYMIINNQYLIRINAD